MVVAVIIAAEVMRDRVFTALRRVADVSCVGSVAEADILSSDATCEVDVPVIVIGNRATITAALRDGAAGGLRPSFTASQLRITIAAVSEGLVCADTWQTARRARHRHALADEEVDELPPQPLTAREAEVLAALTTGASNNQIARTLAISVHTVKFHVAAVIAKLGATGRTDAAARALRASQAMV